MLSKQTNKNRQKIWADILLRKICSALFVIEERQVITTVRYHYTRMSKIKKADHIKCWQRGAGTGLSYTAGGSNLFGKWFGSFFKNYRMIKQSYYPREMKVYVHGSTCSQMLIAALFVITSNCKQPKSSSSEWMNKCGIIHTAEYSLEVKKNVTLLINQV